jgi:hypothetical protein
MRHFFADTFYWVALLSRHDAWHEQVTAFNHTLLREDLFLTTDAIILEFLAAFSGAGAYLRQQAVARVEAMLLNPYIRVIEATRAQLLDGLALYKNRPDTVCCVIRLAILLANLLRCSKAGVSCVGFSRIHRLLRRHG